MEFSLTAKIVQSSVFKGDSCDFNDKGQLLDQGIIVCIHFGDHTYLGKLSQKKAGPSDPAKIV